ncbi:uncharacterized protein LOC131026026 [Salvia miltiorrhiza]|uniref:uncharacterized protein LOC131026026 n=1 Tax=Salvia miltiorrhiza TaxID=226208 RepID=UPI0025AD793D|nr:uncharacterized protein LOC131026026 [Salvia miltiorrhiza]
MNVFRFKPQMNVIELQDDINLKYAIQPSKGRLYRAKEEALRMLRGTVTHHYGMLRSYISELMRVDREGRYELLTEDRIFKALYIGFSALKKGFMEGCRRIIGLDGCFLKTHLGGQLLCAIAKDGNNQMFPIAWAVVEVENESCWRWFLKILLEELGIEDGLGVTFISDQQKGLQNAVKELAPFAEHRNCARHVYCNWKKQFKGATLKNIFWRAVRSTYRDEFDAAVEEMRQENQSAYDDFMEKDHHRFCKVFVSTHCNSDMVDNNVSETFNGYIVKARGKHIINMLEDIRVALRERQYKNLESVKNVKVGDKLCPNIKKKLEKAKYDSRLCRAHPGLGGKFEVQHFDDRFIVTLGDKSCSCRLWDITGIPCVHALSAINFMKEDSDAYVHECYSIDKYLRAYNYGMEPINGEKMWPKAVGLPVKPPEVRVMPGRPKKKRKRDRDEIEGMKPQCKELQE